MTNGANGSNPTRMVQMVFPDQTNHYGTLFGGKALELMDSCAFITATRHCRENMVTASSERVDFRVPVHAGELVELVGRVAETGKSSVTVEVELYAEELLTGERRLCTKGEFVLVAVNEDGETIPID